MRTICKQGDGGHALQQAHAQPPATPEEANQRWQRFGHKDAVIQALLAEQYHLCCYSELRADEELLGYHIEHIENKGQNPARTFDYANLAASALGSADLQSFKARGEEVFGGHAPGKAGRLGPVDMRRFITPHQPGCARYFAYLSDGRVVPAAGLGAYDHDRAHYTIALLNLNSPFLVTRRRQWWGELQQLWDEHQHNDWRLPDLVAVCLLPTGGKLQRFFTLTRQFFGPLAEQQLQQHAPNLL